ncbi:hypothetical protein ACFLR2_01010, partial [Chlamydiota bacterium]
MRDTSPAMEEKMFEMIRQKTPYERALMGASMFETSKKLIISGILQDNPDISPAELRKELFLKFYGNDFTPKQSEKIIRYL